MGVFLAIPLKRQMINQEQLPFPSESRRPPRCAASTAAAATRSKKAYSLVIALPRRNHRRRASTPPRTSSWRSEAFSSGCARTSSPCTFPIWSRPTASDSFAGKPFVAFGFEPSVLLIAAGMIVGLRVSLSMLGASLLLNGVIGPWLSGHRSQHAGAPGYIPSIPMVGGGTIYHAVRWGLWGGTAVIVFSSLASLALQWPTMARSFTMFRRSSQGPAETGDLAAKMAAIEVPNAWLIAGLIPITIGLVAVQIIAFHIAWWAGLIAVGMSFILSMVACRATGETDTTPIGAMGKVMQLLFAVISPGNVTHNLMSAGTAANSASSSADLLTDLKSGYLLGANPRRAVHRAVRRRSSPARSRSCRPGT